MELKESSSYSVVAPKSDETDIETVKALKATSFLGGR